MGRAGDRAAAGPRLTGANIEHAGVHNQRVVLQAIRIAGAATRSEIAEVTGLTPATVSNITNRLLVTELLKPAGQRRGGRGQPAMRLVVNPAGAFSIGVNVDRDHLTMVVVDFSGNVRARLSLETAFPLPDEVQQFYRRNVARLVQEAGIGEGAVTGIGVALPDDLGAVDLPGRPDSYRTWTTVDVAALFACPITVPVTVANDAAAAAIGEMQFGRGRQHASFFYLLVTFGLGGGVVVNSLYDHGANGRSGEIGFLIVDDGVGGRTPLQNVVSLAGLARALAEDGLDVADLWSQELPNARVTAVADAWVERAAQALVEPIISISCLLDPGVVLIGGRLPIALVQRLAERVNALAAERGRYTPALAQAMTAELAEDSPAVGAALLAFGHLLLPADAGVGRRVVAAGLS